MIAEQIIKIDLDWNEDGQNLRYFKNSALQSFFVFNSTCKSADNTSSCREIFSTFFSQKTTFIGIASRVQNIDKLNEFFQIIENRLNLKKRTVFYKTQHKYIIICNVSPFWRSTSLTRQMFTLFVRCGSLYFKDTFAKAINAYPLSKRIKIAINYFLDGHTKNKTNLPIVGWRGVVFYFHNKTLPQIKKLLSK